jgi:HD-GYP domain-containing protein (c-di-GMP phosphodiesterase class II)
MKLGEMHIKLWELVSALSKTFDLMNPALAQHNLRVACLSVRLTEELGLPEVDRADIALAGALHDIGAFTLKERLDLFNFEDKNVAAHAKAGALLLRGFPPFEKAAPIVLFHHLPWAQGKGATSWGRPVPLGSHILHLADRVVVLISRNKGVLLQADHIREVIAAHAGEIFHPDVVAAFTSAARRDSLWLEVAAGGVDDVLSREFAASTVSLQTEGLLALAKLLCRIIDFKSEFTATHTSGVAAAGTSLARLIGFSPGECRLFEIAAFLHDLGKLAVPTEILEKPGKLSPDEWNIMRTHVYFTYQILCPLEALGVIGSWGALHQERLDGSGYPFGYNAEQLPLGARIMAVADVFTAITEDRPYRGGMPRAEAVAALRQMAGQREIDGRIVEVLLEHYDEIDAARAESQAAARLDYAAFREEISSWGPGTSVGVYTAAGGDSSPAR